MAAPQEPGMENKAPIKPFSFEKLLPDIRFHIINKMELDDVNRLRQASKDTEKFIASRSSALTCMRRVDNLIVRKEKMWFAATRCSYYPARGSFEWSMLSRRLHAVNVDMLRIDVPLTEQLLLSLTKSRIQVRTLVLWEESESSLINELVVAVRPRNVVIDLTDKENGNLQHLPNSLEDIGNRSIDLTDLVDLDGVQDLFIYAKEAPGFSLSRLPKSVTTIVCTAPVSDMDVNNFIRDWSRCGRNVQRLQLMNVLELQADGTITKDHTMRIEKVLESTGYNDIHPHFMLHESPQMYVVDRNGAEESMLVIHGTGHRISMLGPKDSTCQHYKNQRQPR